MRGMSTVLLAGAMSLLLIAASMAQSLVPANGRQALSCTNITDVKIVVVTNTVPSRGCWDTSPDFNVKVIEHVGDYAQIVRQWPDHKIGEPGTGHMGSYGDAGWTYMGWWKVKE
jgi:hypothetical protein